MPDLTRKILLLALILASITPIIGRLHAADAWEELDKQPVPEWWRDGKFGIFIHWGLYSVPAWCDGWYAEWYYRLIQAQHPGGSATMQRHHKEVYGEDFRYPDFAPMFRAERYDPEAWAKLFADSGAAYVVLTSKHHDGYCLWDAPSSKGWNAVDVGPGKDLIGPLAEAVRAEGMKFGLYYSLLEWDHGDNLPGNRFGTGDAYVTEHAHPQIKDLVKRYRPSILWADGEWGHSDPDYWRGSDLLTWYANYPGNEGNVAWNDRWGKGHRGKHGMFYTTEYGKDGQEGGEHPWEETRGIGESFGYNSWYEDKDERYPSTQDLLDVFVPILSRGGNFLLNVGPKADGTLIQVFHDRLRDIGGFLKINGEAVYGSRMPAVSRQGEKIYFTQDKKGKIIYAFIKELEGDELVLENVYLDEGESVTMLGDPEKRALPHKIEGKNLQVSGYADLMKHGDYYWVFRIPGGFHEMK